MESKWKRRRRKIECVPCEFKEGLEEGRVLLPINSPTTKERKSGTLPPRLLKLGLTFNWSTGFRSGPEEQRGDWIGIT